MFKVMRIPMFTAVVVLFAVSATGGWAAQLDEPAEDRPPVRLEASPEKAAAAEVAADAPGLIAPPALWMGGARASSKTPAVQSLTCTAPPGCFDPETYCQCVDSGSVAVWACRWYFCES